MLIANSNLLENPARNMSIEINEYDDDEQLQLMTRTLSVVALKIIVVASTNGWLLHQHSFPISTQKKSIGEVQTTVKFCRNLQPFFLCVSC